MKTLKEWMKSKNGKRTTSKKLKELQKDELVKVNGGTEAKPVKHDLVLDIVE